MGPTLHATPVVVLDAQATGASPRHGHLLELGWSVTRAELEPDATAIRSSTIALPEGAEIPPVVRELTGIGPDDLVDAPPASVLWSRLLEEVGSSTAAATDADPDGVAIAVVHFARFEQAFLHDLHARERPGTPFPLRMLCTHEIARRLLPGMPRLGLRALAGYFGHGAEAPRRAHGHVWATAIVWHHLVGVLAERGITDLAGLDALLGQARVRATKREYPMPKATRLALPDAPGVYRMLRTGGDVLYVGKATSLRKRVNSYFQKQRNVPEHLLEMLSQARELDVTPTASALEAAVLECDEIKRLAPPFNTALGSRDRAAWFAGDVLDDLDERADGRHRLGPLGSPWPARRLAALQRALVDGPLAADGRAALGWVDARELDPDALAAAVAGFAAELAGARLDRREVMRRGAALWRARLDAGVPVAEPDDDASDDAPEPAPWTAEEIHAELVEVVVALARAVRRARWLTRLTEASVAFVDGGARRRLVIERGLVVERGDHDPARGLPMPPGAALRDAERRRAFDLATFDRLRVLTSELRRIVDAGGYVAVRLERGRILDGPRLRRVLAWT